MRRSWLLYLLAIFRCESRLKIVRQLNSFPRIALIFKPFRNLILLENQIRLHSNMNTFVVPTRGAEFLYISVQLTVSKFFTAKIPFPCLSSPEECSTWVAGNGSVVFSYFECVQMTDQTLGHFYRQTEQSAQHIVMTTECKLEYTGTVLYTVLPRLAPATH